MSDVARSARQRRRACPAAWLCGYRTRLSLGPTTRRAMAGGQCEVLNPDAAATDLLLIALAPFAAGADPLFCWHDLIEAVDLARSLNPDNPVDLLRDYHVGAINVLTRRRIAHARGALASVLADRGKLGPQDVDQVILSALAEPIKGKTTPNRPTRSRRRSRRPVLPTLTPLVFAWRLAPEETPS